MEDQECTGPPLLDEVTADAAAVVVLLFWTTEFFFAAAGSDATSLFPRFRFLAPRLQWLKVFFWAQNKKSGLVWVIF